MSYLSCLHHSQPLFLPFSCLSLTSSLLDTQWVHCVSGWLGILGQLGKIHLIYSNSYCGHRGWVSRGAETKNNFHFIFKTIWDMLFKISLSPKWLPYLLILYKTQRVLICCRKWKRKKQQTLTFKRLDQEYVWHFCSKIAKTRSRLSNQMTIHFL